jgi:hypothetical protein
MCILRCALVLVASFKTSYRRLLEDGLQAGYFQTPDSFGECCVALCHDLGVYSAGRRQSMNVGMPLTIEKGSFLRFLRPRSSPRRGGGGRNDDDDDYDDRGGGWGGGGGGKSVTFRQGSARVGSGTGLPTKSEFLARGGGLSAARGWPERDPREDARNDAFYLDPYIWKGLPGGSSVRLRPGSKEDEDERAHRRAKEHRRRSPSPAPASDDSDDRRRPPPSRKKTPPPRRVESSDDEDVRRPPKGGSRSGGARSRKAASSDDDDPPPKRSSKAADGEDLNGGSANSTLPCYPHMFDKDGYVLGDVGRESL